MNLLLTLFFFLLIIGFLIFVHELGHFIAAKLSGVDVYEFAIGFGPTIIAKHYKGTNYQIKVLPLGGFVNLEGEQDSDSPTGFRNKSFKIKAFILLGGVIMNTLTAIIFIWIFLLQNNYIFPFPRITDYSFANTKEQSEYYPIFLENAEEAFGWSGTSEDDWIVGLEGVVFTDLDHVSDLLDEYMNQAVMMDVLDVENLDVNQKKVTIGGLYDGEFSIIEFGNVQEYSNYKDVINPGDTLIGINDVRFGSTDDFLESLDSLQNTSATFNFIDLETGEEYDREISLGEKNENGELLAIEVSTMRGIDLYTFADTSSRISYFVEINKNIVAPVLLTYDLSVYQMKAIAQIFSDAFKTNDFTEVKETIGGPVAVGKMVSDVVEVQVYESFIFLTALISLSLATFNVLPIPALDGGQLAIAGFESLRRKKLSDDAINRINMIGFIFIISFSILILLKDIDQFNIVGGISDGIEKIFGK